MSHFSKIKTSITNLELLKKTIQDLGFFYKVSINTTTSDTNETLFVYDLDPCHIELPSCSFQWSHDQYVLIVDLGLWNLDIDFNYFTERLLQQYAYNIVVQQGNIQGFNCVNERLTANGSISLTLQKF
uniref:Uncharacterized protein ycf35 n=1 Tax=Polysiphonia elongata TaxID=159753 RepID=A0A1Z1MB90_9FLOR|nr:hypothetical protein [Polysiphonia elongata]ARW63246.1 hypothetical protein [Polysiphonia elongata]